jgi:hypothetical protein
MTRRLTFLTALMVSLFPTLSHSAIITLDFTGKVTDIFDPQTIIGNQVALGAPVKASIRYDTLFPDTPPSGFYENMPGWLKVTIGGLLFEQTNGYYMSVTHDTSTPFSAFLVYTYQTTGWPASLPQFDFAAFAIQFSEDQPPFDLLSSDAPPASFDITRADWNLGSVVAARIEEGGKPAYEIRFELTQQAEIVPEPGTLSLLALGFGTVAFRRLLR